MTASPAPASPTPGASARILVADDDETLLRTLTWILTENGYDVIPVTEPRALFERLDETGPDLLMLDIMMPKVDGLQLLARLKAHERWRDLPVLMISSMPPEEATVRSLGLGAADFVPKPFRVRELIARVQAHLRTGEALRRARETARSSVAMVDILHEVTDATRPDEIFQILTRRVGRLLDLARCSMVLAKEGGAEGVVVAAYEDPALRDLKIDLRKYPEILHALSAKQPVLVANVATDPLYAEIRRRWEWEGTRVPTRSAIAVPFQLRGGTCGVFFLRNNEGEPRLTEADARFADSVISKAVTAIEKGYDFAAALSDKQRYEQLATVDQLTGCLNRRALQEKLEAEVERARRYAFHLTLLLLDLDRFKHINDTRGHLAGDAVLRQVGAILREEVRSVDIVGRFGGEEFLVGLPNTAADGGLVFAERLRLRIADHPFAIANETLRVTVSIGVASFAAEGSSGVEDLFARADAALYRAKDAGRNLVRV
jgi:two-component system cell cycle response regulator